MQTKYDKQKAKLATVEESCQSVSSQHDILKVQLESEKAKHEITLAEREKDIAGLKAQLEATKERETSLTEKVEKVEQKARDEYQRLVEMYESSGRYKELRDIYEGKLEAKESELLQAKESFIQRQLKEEATIKEHEK